MTAETSNSDLPAKTGFDFTSLDGWKIGFTKPERMPIDEWLRRVSLGAGYAIQGPFRAETSRYLIEPLRCIQSDEVREVSVLAAVQTGKTLVAEMGIAWSTVNAPGATMWTMQSDEDAKEHCEGRFNALLRTVPEISALLPTMNRHRVRTTETFFASHMLLVNGANKNNLQSKSIRWKFNSELWLWKEGLLGWARSRVDAFARAGTSKIVNESQAGQEGTDWQAAWESGSQEDWSVECQGCGKYSPLDFFGRMHDNPEERACVIWDQGANINQAVESAKWRCPHCGHDHDDTPRTRAIWNNSGKYVSKRIDAPKENRSFHWNALTCHSLGEMVRQWLESVEQKKKGNIEPMRNFYQQRLAIFWKLDEERELIVLRPGGYTLSEILQNPSAKISNEAYRFMSIDRQRDHFWAIVRAWRSDGSSRLLWRGKTLTSEQNREIAERFGVEDQLVFQDAQHATAQVYEDCVKWGWTALHGAGENGFQWVLANGAKVRKFYTQLKFADVPGGRARYMHWASDPIKDTLYRLRAGLWLEWETPDDADEPGSEKFAYSRQLNGDHKRERINKTTGRSEWRWTKVGENHYADCEAMQVVAAIALQVLKIEAVPEAKSDDKND